MRTRERILAALVVLLGIGVAAALFALVGLRGQVTDNAGLIHALQKQVTDLGGKPLTAVPKPKPKPKATTTPRVAPPTPRPTAAPTPPRTVVVTAKPAATPRPSPSRTSRPSPSPTPSRSPSPTPSQSTCVPVIGCVPRLPLGAR